MRWASLLLGTLLLASATGVLADEVTDDLDRPSMWRMRSLRVGPATLRVSLSNDPDTVWIGHIADPSWVPRDRNGNPVPSSARDASGAPSVPGTVPIGGYGPYHLGRGSNLPGGDVSQGIAGGANTSFNGIWDFDHFQAGDDTLQGWWPIARPYHPASATPTQDKQRACMGLNYGNQGNYVINQGVGYKRTFGVTGYWHRDAGNFAPPVYGATPPGTHGPNVEWAPLAGTQSAWCGLRAADDFNAIDQVSLGGTGNPINQRVIEYNGNESYNQIGAVNTAGGTDKNFPGYGSQWDQILYRDIDVSSIGVGDNLSISFSYSHALSPVRSGTSLQRIGYFWKDPIRSTDNMRGTGVPFDGNFVSATEAEPTLQGPVDSFTVTLGVPVEPVAGPPGIPNDYVASDGNSYEIYDVQRRWFSEVIATTQAGDPASGAPMIELLSRCRFSAAGGGVSDPPFSAPPVTTVSATSIKRDPNGSALEKSLAALCSASGGRVRIAFRVLTNRGDDDEDNFVTGFTSFTRGAAIVDDVVIQRNGAGSNLITNGDFEADNSIDNRTAMTALDAWKSTGKPPGVYVHPHCVNTNCTQYTPGLWNDPCSPPTLTDPKAGNRTCNMVGNVLSGGDHDVNEKPGGLFGANDMDRMRLGVSPVIIIKTDPDPTQYNPMGLNSDIIANASEWALWFDIHTAGFRGAAGNGNYRSIGLQSYPAQQTNGVTCWGETRWSTAITFNTSNTCIPNLVSLKQAGFIDTSNPSGVPDSIRVHVQYNSRCFSTVLTAAQCSPTTGTQVGNYIDNFSFSIVHGPLAAGLSLGGGSGSLASPWMWYMDGFPTYVDPSTGLPKTSFAASDFDTATAKVKSAINRSSFLGTTARPNVPGDSAQVTSGAFPNLGRLDLVFRILPGPGNYTTVGQKLSQIRQVPTSLTPAVGNAASTNFWENYMGNTGAFGTGGNGVSGIAMDPDGGGPIAPGTRWDWNAWCSARMDTLERNLWPALSNASNLASTSGGSDWQTTYHEQDPRFAQLGVAKNRCFLANPAAGQPVSCKSRTPASTADCNVVCELLPGGAPFGVFPPAWTAAAGLVAENGLPLGQTYEFTKIIPDGQLTPGSHVQYFYRREPGQMQPVDIWPDTTQIFDGSTADGGRWFNFSVLPDNWKKQAYGGLGLLCMLVVDNFDRNGDEFYWVSAADSIGLTEQGKRGAHNGWYASGGQNIGNTFSQATLRRDNGGQPGTMWDLWNTKAGESLTTGAAWLSSRYTTQPAAGSFMEGKTNTQGPTGDMLRFFYKSLLYLTGTAVGTNFGSVPDRGDDDFAQLNDFALWPTAGVRSVMVWGSGFAEDLTGAAGGPIPTGGPAFLNSFFGTSLTNLSYRTFSGNVAPVAHLGEAPGSAHDLAGAQSGLTYGLIDNCGIENDVLAAVPPLPGFSPAVQTFAENVGANGPYPASIYVPSGGGGSAHPQITLLDGTRISRVGSWSPVQPLGRKNFLYDVLKSVSITMGAIACSPLISPVGVGDDPISGSSFVNFAMLRSSNPVLSGEARLAFTLAKSERTQVRVFDVAGRLVKTVANRVFAAGQEHVMIWDGTDEAGNKVKRGVYFYRLQTPTWTSQKKLALLSN